MERLAYLVRTGPSLFDSVTRSGHSVSVDGEAGGGPTPMEMLLLSLASCAGATVETLIEKMRGEVAGIRITVDAVRAEKVPRVWSGIDLCFVIRSSLERSRVERALDVTDRTCPVSVMIEPGTRLGRSLVTVERVEAEVTRPLRQRLLRPLQGLDALQVSGEDDGESAWLAAFDAGGVVGTAGIVAEPAPDGSPGWRVRAMAVEESLRGRGVGAELLAGCLDHAAGRQERTVWCSARVPALDFYRGAGFVVVGEVYEEPGIGPHVTMVLAGHASR